jgi:hypothetical protein
LGFCAAYLRLDADLAIASTNRMTIAASTEPIIIGKICSVIELFFHGDMMACSTASYVT